MRNSQIENTIKVSDKKIPSSDRLLLCLFSLFIVLHILANTTVGGDIIKYIRIIRFVIYAIFLLDAVIDFLFGQRTITLTLFIVVLCSFFIFLYSRDNGIIVLVLFLVELSKVNFSDIVKYSVITVLICIAAVLLFALVGVLDNTAFSRGNVTRYGLGFGWTTIGPSCFVFACLGLLYLEKNRIDYIVILGLTVLGVIFFLLTDTRMAFLFLLVIVAIALVTKLFKNTKIGKFGQNVLSSKLLIVLPFLFVLLSAFFVVYYKYRLPYWDELNSLLSDRLRLSVRAFDEIGVNLFGHNIEWKGWNQDTFFIENFDYLYVDNAYFKILFDYGIVGLVLVILGYTFALRSSIKQKNSFLTVAIILCLINALISPSLLSFETNVFVFTLAPIMCGEKIADTRIVATKSDMKSSKTVVAVVVTFNRKTLLRESLFALLKSDYDYLKIVVVDNASTDGTYDFVKDIFAENPDKIKYFNTGENIGGAGGFNFGIKKALELNADYIWLMDDDCIVENASLNELINAAHNLKDDFGFLSSKVLWKDGSISKMNLQRRSLSDKKFDYDKTCQKIRLASFVSLFLNGKAVEAVGLPHKDFFIWGDDWEYSYRLSEKFDCYYVAESVVHHKSNVNVGVDISSETDDRLKRFFYYYRNEGCFYRKSGLIGVFYYISKVAYHIFKVVFSKSNSKKQRLGILFKGFFASWKFNPKVEYAYKADTEIKVLEFFGEPISYGGQEAFIINFYNSLKSRNISYTLCTPFNCDNDIVKDMVVERGDTVVSYNKNFDSVFRKFHIVSAAKTILRENDYDVVHIHSGSVYTLKTVAKIAKKHGVKKVIVHSHATGNNNLKYKIIKKLSDICIDKYADEYFACSLAAGQWKFPKKIIESDRFEIIKNGIITENYAFSEQKRLKYRNELGLKDDFTICQVGRFAPEKNHIFTLSVLQRLKEMNFNFRCVFVGDGLLKQEIAEKVKSLNLIQNVIFLEKRNDVAEIMMAADVCLFPSVFEGLGITVIEAQTTGLKTIISKNVPEDVILTDLVVKLPLENTDAWVKEIICSEKVENRTIYNKIIESSSFNAKKMAHGLEKAYRGYVR